MWSRGGEIAPEPFRWVCCFFWWAVWGNFSPGKIVKIISNISFVSHWSTHKMSPPLKLLEWSQWSNLVFLVYPFKISVQFGLNKMD